MKSAVASLALALALAADPDPSCSDARGENTGSGPHLSFDFVVHTAVVSGFSKCWICGNYCGPGWCGSGWNKEGAECAPLWDTVTPTDHTDSCCQVHGAFLQLIVLFQA